MKKAALFCGALLLAGTMFFVACGKDAEATIKNFFQINNASLISEEMPAATSEQTIDVVMNGNVIPGGSSYVTVVAENVVKKILIGLKDQTGYYEFVPETSSDRGYSYSFVMMVDQNITLPEGQQALEIMIAIIDENGDVSQMWQTPIEIIEVGTGGLQVSLTFDNAKDVDLHLVEPEGVDYYGDSLTFYERHIYYGNRYSANGGWLDLDSNAGCNIDNVNNENITYNDSTAYIAPGEYKVYVDMWSNCDPSIPTNYVVTVLYNGALIATQTGTNPYAGYFEVDYPSGYHGSSLGDLQPVLTFVIPDNGQQPIAKSQQPAPMTESAMEKEAISAEIYGK